MEDVLKLTEKWDKTFPKSEKVDHRKVTFHNRYGITLAADLYAPKGAEGRLPAMRIQTTGSVTALRVFLWSRRPREMRRA